MYTHSNTCYVHTQWPLHKKAIFQSLQEDLLPSHIIFQDMKKWERNFHSKKKASDDHAIAAADPSAEETRKRRPR